MGLGVGEGVAECVGVAKGDGEEDGGGEGECVGGVGVIVTGGGMKVGEDSGVGGGASTEIVPCPVRMPSVAVTVAAFVAVNDGDAEAGVFAGSRAENDEPETRTVTVTDVRLAKRTQPPVVTSTEETSKFKP